MIVQAVLQISMIWSGFVMQKKVLGRKHFEGNFFGRFLSNESEDRKRESSQESEHRYVLMK